MDMTEDNELLLKQFFSSAAQQQIADEGFTARVMQRLPQRERLVFNLRWFNRLWTLLCVAVFIAVFIALRGWELLAIHLEVMLRTLPTESVNINPLMLATILFGLLFVGVGEVVYNEK